MRAMQIVGGEGEPELRAAEMAQPKPGPGEILVRVCAAGVTKTELGWYPTTHLKGGEARVGGVPGHEFSGVVTELGKGVTAFVVGDAVYGMNDWFADGATAEFCVAAATSVAYKPAALSHIEAASVPIGALTAWQGLFDRAKLRAGERVLVQGGAGAVGLFVVQLAKRHGAEVIATASANTLELVKELGATEVIDYRAERFEDKAKDVDVVFDTVGGETRTRSLAMMKKNARLITIASDAEGTTDARVKEAFFIVEPKQEQLIEVAKLLDDGKLRTFVDAVVPLEDAGKAYSGAVAERLGYGKLVVRVSGDRGLGGGFFFGL